MRRGPTAAPAQPEQLDVDTALIDSTLRAKAKVAGGVYQFGIPRAEPVRDGGMEVPVPMGSGEAINFQPTGGGKAAITGDFVLTAQEVNPVLRTLRANSIEVTALHNHMPNDEPRLFFMHFSANDDAGKLAKRIRVALGQDQLRPKLTVGAVLRLALAGSLVVGMRWSALPSLAAQPPPAPLVLEASIPLPDTGGRIDHMAVDLKRGRLFVAELGNGTVDVVDLASQRVKHRIPGLREPQGVGYSPTADILAVASAGDGSVRLFRGEDLAAAGVIQLGSDADNIHLDGPGRFVVGHGGGALAVLDPASRAVVGEASLPAHPEGFAIGPQGRAFVNLPDAGQIAVVALPGGQLLTSWRVPGFGENFPMALSGDGTRLAAAFRSPPRLVLLDASMGSVLQSAETCRDADDVFFDERRRRIYVSCGAGGVAVMQDGPGGYRNIGLIPTGFGARTSLFVPELDRLFVARRSGLLGGAGAAIMVFRPVDGGPR